MGRDYEEARRFSEEIDRMLSGEDVRAGNELDEDTRTALDFACWMTTVRPEPSPAFKARLNARMMQKINEQESEARRGWFWRLIPREAAWQAAVAMVLMLVIGGSLWGILFRASGRGSQPSSGYNCTGYLTTDSHNITTRSSDNYHCL